MSQQVSVKLLLPIYVKVNASILHSLRWFIKALLTGFDINEISVIQTTKRFTDIQLTGNDAPVAKNFLIKVVGGAKRWEDIKFGEEIMGRIVGIDKESIYVDIGLLEPDYFKVKVNLLEIIRKIYRVNKLPNEDLINQMGFRKYLPFSVKIFEDSEMDREKRIIHGKMGSFTFKFLKKLLLTRLDKLIVYGATRSAIEKALELSNHKRDVVNIERIGFLEHVIICKWGTSSIGLIPEIGNFLPDAKFVAIRPRYLKKQIYLI